MIQGRTGDVDVYIDSYAQIEQAVRRTRSKMTLKQDKIGDHFLVSVNEAKRVVAICVTEKVGDSSFHSCMPVKVIYLRD